MSAQSEGIYNYQGCVHAARINNENKKDHWLSAVLCTKVKVYITNFIVEK